MERKNNGKTGCLKIVHEINYQIIVMYEMLISELEKYLSIEDWNVVRAHGREGCTDY